MTTQRKRRTFESTTEGRGILPILFGLAAPSSGGKTLSALRLATGIERRMGAKTPEDFRRRIQFIDTESKRALQYRRDGANPDGYEFSHLHLTAPFSPLDYLDAIEQAVEAGAKTIIIDQLTYEHEGDGGVLELHVHEQDRLARSWFRSKLSGNQEPEAWMLEKANFSAWDRPKSQRRKLLNALTTRWAGMNFILCFRARPKVRKAEKGEKDEQGRNANVVSLGLMPQGFAGYLFEMTARALLPQNANGVPVWESDEVGERTVFKLPRHFRDIFLPPHQLCEEDGEKMATWALGVHADKATTQGPTFVANFEWPGQEAWSGKPLAEAPAATLAEYGAELEKSIATSKSKTRADKVRAHLDDVRKAADAAQKGAS